MAKVKITGHASGSGVLTITAPNTSTDRTITLPDATGTLLNSDGSGASLTSVNAVNTGRKNLIINGSMKVAQRGASFTDPASGAYTLDRWRAGVHTSTAAANYTQEADAPTAAQAGTNFVNCLKIDVTTADTSTAATVRYYTRYHVEGNDLARAGFGQSGVRYMTLSFWHKHTKTGINSFGLVSNDNGRHYVAEYTQTNSDTWEKATHTFPVDTTGTWLTDTGNGMTIYLVSHIGSNYQKSANAWAAGNGYGTANQVNNFDSTSNNMRFTGVQLEMGSVATDFEHRSYGEELALCQRYFASITGSSGGYGTALAVIGQNAYGRMANLPVPMRAVPTCAAIGTFKTHNSSGGAITASAVVLIPGFTQISGYITVSSGLSGGNASLPGFNNGHTITADAEL